MDSHQRIAESFALQGLMSTLGASLAFVNDGEVHIAMPASAHISQQHGYAHAGAITSILDSACGYAALTKAAEGHEVVTEFKINLMRLPSGFRISDGPALRHRAVRPDRRLRDPAPVARPARA